MRVDEVLLLVTALLCALVAGIVLTFAVVVMPGIRRLPDRDYLRAFQTIDRVIQNNDPVFMVVWVGSALAAIAVVGLTLASTGGLDGWLPVLTAVGYIVGVQLPTAIVNVPLNNRLQSLDLDTLDSDAVADARQAFEARWNRWNAIRTACAVVTTVLWLTLLART